MKERVLCFILTEKKNNGKIMWNYNGIMQGGQSVILEQVIGIIGGGQLGKMLILSAKKLGFKVITLDPVEDCPAHSIADEHIIADFDNEKAIRELVEKCNVTTYEFEHINADILIQLVEEGNVIYPSPNHLQIIQNKYTQKMFLQKQNIPIPAIRSISTMEEAIAWGNTKGYPIMIKSALGGYDGKGNFVYTNERSLRQELPSILKTSSALFVEEWIDYQMEISVLASRGKDGQIEVYPPVLNSHKDSILDETIYPAGLSKELEKKALKMATKIMECFAGVGLFCMELFVCQDGHILVNEIAPRTHNSGHYTMEACITSQFEQHLRAISGLPLGATEMRVPYAVMKNLIGPKDIQTKEVHYEGIEKVLTMKDVHLHIYGKKKIQAKRKMGHITVCGENKQEVLATARKAHRIIHQTLQEGES